MIDDKTCRRCGRESESVRQRPHSTAEIGLDENPHLCRECDREVIR